jgi:predicted acyltransferase
MNDTTTRRADALDALRGLAILLMILSGAIHYIMPLPAWMYHAQVPPPAFIFNPNLPGITWVDLVFPFFLFAMGAAFPFALSKKIENGTPQWKIVIQILQRGVLLVWFAIFIQHIKPYSLHQEPTPLDWLTGLLGFTLLFAMLLRLPQSLKQWQRVVLKIAAYGAAVLLLAVLRYPQGGGFSIGRSDIIIIVLANTAVFGSLLWLWTRNTPLVRLGILGILLALRLTQNIDGSWNQWLWMQSPIPWAYKLYYLQYLFVVIPGSFVGDMIHAHIHSAKAETAAPHTGSMSILLVLMALIVVTTVTGLFLRLSTLTIIVDMAYAAWAFVLLSTDRSVAGLHYKKLLCWGADWLLLGLCFEAYEGGIKKDHPTLSYYFVMDGLAIMAYIALSVIIDVLRRRRIVALLIENGQNPMIAYIAGATVIMPVMAIFGIDTVIGSIPQAPWVGLAKGIFITMMVALLTSFFTKRKLFWRT